MLLSRHRIPGGSMKTRQHIPLAGLAITIAVSSACVAEMAGAGNEPRLIAGGRFEASGVASVAGSPGVLFVDDGQERQVYWLELAADGTQVGNATPVALGANVVDPEGITASGTHYYVVGSQSKAKSDGGDSLIRFAFAEASRRVSGLERVTGLKAWLTARVPELQGRNTLDIEGLAWDPLGRRLLLGLRTPVVDGSALVIPIELIDSGGAFETGNLRVSDGAAIRLALGGSGIRSLEYDEAAKSFLVIAGDERGGGARLLEWNGEAAGPLRAVATFPNNLKPEGVAHVTLGAKPVRVVVFDTGRVSVLD
jgi:hypothetical protein